MATHESQVSEGTIQALKTLIGRRVHTVYAPILDVAGTHVAARSFAILISGQIGNQWSHRFLNLKAIWSETPRLLHDYWKLQTFEDQRSLGISVDAENAILSPCLIQFYENGGSEVTEIQVYTLSSPDPEDLDESVVYDKAIDFVRGNGTSFCIACQLNGPCIANDVHLTEDPVIRQEFLKDCQLRLTLP